MHELSLMEEVLAILSEQAQAQGFTQVRRVLLSIGKLSGVEPESLAFCFEAVVAGSLAQGAALEIHEVPGTGWCAACGRAVALESRFDPCPLCGAGPLPVTAGAELRVEALDVLE